MTIASPRSGCTLLPLFHLEAVVDSTRPSTIPSTRAQFSRHSLVPSNSLPPIPFSAYLPNSFRNTHARSRIRQPAPAVVTNARSIRTLGILHCVRSISARSVGKTAKTCSTPPASNSPAAPGKSIFCITSAASASASAIRSTTEGVGIQAAMGVDESSRDAGSPNDPVPLKGIAELAESGQYKAWILDQFGVLHDGKKAYPEAVHALQQLAASGVKIVLLSNSSRQAEVAAKKLPTLGFDPSLFTGIITSGDMTFNNLKSRSDPWFASLGRKCLHLTWSARGAVSLDGLDLTVVDSPEEADFILAHGTEAVAQSDGSILPATLEHLHSLLERAAAEGRRREEEKGRRGDVRGRDNDDGRGIEGIPMVIANPDFVTVEERALRVMPGTLGKQYSDLGGFVRCMGKPDPVVFYAAQTLTGVDFEHSVMVGDSLHHDIKGAASVGMRSVFVAGGIHANDLDIPPAKEFNEDLTPSEWWEQKQEDSLQTLVHAIGANPSYVMPYFKW